MSQIGTIRRARTSKSLCCLLASTVLTAVEGAQGPVTDQPAVDKSAFHLFNPTPPDYLREMDTDGPGATESPYTVDAGHFQFEMALVSYTTDRDPFGGVTQR